MKNSTSLTRFLGAAAFLGLIGAASAQITPGNLVVVRFGDGVAANTNASTAVFLEQYTTIGGPVNIIPMPVVAAGANQPFTNSGTSTSEGFITQSSNNNYLVLGGYGTVPGSVGSVVTSASSVVPRVIARVDLTGAIDTTTALGDTYSGLNIRSACSDNGAQFWMGGSNEGVRYASSLGATTSIVVNAGVTNVRNVDIYAGQLYVSANSGAYHGPSTVGVGLPTNAANPTTLLPGFPVTGPSYYDYFFADAATLYVTNDNATTGGIEKWIDVAGTWTFQYSLVPAVGQGCRGVTGVVNAGVTTLFATTTQAAMNNLVSVTDTGVASPFSILATAITNTSYRGVRLVKGQTSTPSTPFCFGDTAALCPCSAPGGSLIPNPGAAGHGCANSVFPAGAILTTSGNALNNAGDTLVLTATNVPGPTLFFQGTSGAGSILNFNDGRFCVIAGIIRLGIVFPVAGVASYPGGLTPNPIHIAGAPVLGGGVPGVNDRHYQAWYRDIPAFCNPTGHNLSNGVSLTWTP